jgi:hypothetical protein
VFQETVHHIEQTRTLRATLRSMSVPVGPPSTRKPPGLAASDHTVPTGRFFWGGRFPGTSCQATIGTVPAGRKTFLRAEIPVY